MDSSPSPQQQGQGAMIPAPIRRPIAQSLFLGTTTFVDVARLAAILAQQSKEESTMELVPGAIQWLCRAQDFLSSKECDVTGQKISPMSLLETVIELTGQLGETKDDVACFAHAYGLLSDARIQLTAADEKFRLELHQAYKIDSTSIGRARHEAVKLTRSKLEFGIWLRAKQKEDAAVQQRIAKVLGMTEWPKGENGERIRLTYEQVTRVWFPNDSSDKREELMVSFLPFFRCIETVQVSGDSIEYQPDNKIGRHQRQLVREEGMSAAEVVAGARFLPWLRRAHRSNVNRANAARAKGRPKKRGKMKK